MKHTNEHKTAVITAAFDAFAPCMQIGMTDMDKRYAYRHTLMVLADFPKTRENKRFANLGNVPDYCITAAKNLLKLAIVNEAPQMVAMTIQQLFETALQYTQIQYTPAA